MKLACYCHSLVSALVKRLACCCHEGKILGLHSGSRLFKIPSL